MMRQKKARLRMTIQVMLRSVQKENENTIMEVLL